MNEETKNNKEDEPTSSDAHPQDIPTAKKGNWVGKISKALIRALLYSVFFIFLIVAAAGIVLEYYFPAEEARLFAEGQITQQLKLPLKIQKIDFSLFSGLQMDNVVLGFPAMPVAQVRKVVLDYDLTQLLQGKLVINQILVDHPKLTAISKNGVWNFKPLLELKKPSPSPSDNDKPQVLFPIPEIDIKKLTVRSASASLDQGKNLKAHITGLSLEAQGKVSLSTIDLKLKVLLVPDPDAPANIGFQSKGKMNFQSRVFSNLDFSTSDLNRIEISGVFGLENNRLHMKGQLLPSPGLVVDIDAAVSMKPELLDLKKLHLSLGKNNLIKVSGSVANFAKDPSFKLMLNEVSFQLEDLLDWAKQWVSPISGKGQLKAARVNVKGHFSGSSLKELNINGGILSTKNLWINHPAQNAQLEDVDVNLKLKEVVLHNSQVEKVSLDLNMQLKKARIKDAEIKNWKQSFDITAKGKDMRNILLEFRSDMESLHYNHPETKELFLPVHVEGSGHIIKNDFNNLKLSYRLGNLINGEVTGTVKGLGKASIQLDQKLKINLAELADRLPTNLTAKLVEKLQGTAQGQASVTGKLDEKFFPVELNGRANFQLEGLTINLKNPDISIKNLNTRVSFPLEFNAKKGVQIPQLDIHTNLQDAKVLDTFQINDLEIKNKTKIQGFHNLKPEFGTLPVQIDTQIFLGSFISDQPAISLAHLKSDTVLKTDLKANDVRNTRAEGNLSFKDLSAMEKIKIAEWITQFKLDVHDKSLTRVRISQKTRIHKPSFHQDDLALELKSIKLETLSRQNLQEGHIDVETFLLEIPDLVTTRVKAALKKWGKTFSVETQIENLQLSALWDHLPDTFKTNLESLKTGGTLDITLKAKGSLPVNAQEGDGPKIIIPPKPLWAQLLLPDNINNKTPVEIESEIKIQNGFLNDPEKSFSAAKLNTKTRMTFKNGRADLRGSFSAKLEGLTENPLYPEFDYHYALDDLNILRINQHQLILRDNGVQHSLEGYLKGFKPFITGQRPIHPDEILNRLNIQLANTNTIDLSQATEELSGDLKAKGIIESKIKFHQSAGKTLKLHGSLKFDKLSLQLPSGMALENLNGTFPFTKSLQLDPEQMQKQTHDFFPAQKKFFTSLRNFSRYKNIIRADSLEIKGQLLRDIGLDVVFKDNSLMAEKFIFDVLGGSVGGNLFLIQDRQGPVIKFSMEFAGIDSSKLLALPLQKKADSKIDGNLQITLKIHTGLKDQPVSLNQLSVKISITRIGAQTLDRLLLFIDPEESKPAIMDTRAKLKLATPHRIEINLENGNLNVEAWLKSDLLGIFKAPELRRIPISALKRFNTIHEQLQSLKDLEQVSNYLSARGLHFKDEKLILHY